MKKNIDNYSVVLVVALVSSMFLSGCRYSYAAEPSWITTKEKCNIWNSNPMPKESVSWSGDCVNGKASGDGILRWFTDGIESSHDILSKKHGISMSEGYFVANVDNSLIDYKLVSCLKGVKYRGVVMVIHNDIYLDQYSVALDLIKKGSEFAEKECSVGSMGNVNVDVFQGDENQFGKYLKIKNISDGRKFYSELRGIYQEVSMHARSRAVGGEIKWEEYGNAPQARRYQIQKKEYQERLAVLEKAKNKKIAMEKKQKIDAEQEVIRKRRAEFNKKYKVQHWVTAKRLGTNPFVYEGEVVAIVTYFNNMVAADEAIFGNADAVVSSVPRKLFQDKVPVVLAGKVVGKKAIKTPVGGELVLPYLKFIGVHVCKDWNCKDMLQ